jgi:hypothetical protein
MNKRSKITFGLLALIAAFGLVLTGCPDPNNDSSSGSGYTPPTAVGLAAGSHGTAGSGKITGLTPTTVKYAVLDVATGRWYGVKADGTLGNGPSIASVITDAAVLGQDAESNDITAITDPLLVNGRTYSVYVVDTTTTASGNTIGDTSGDVTTGGKNTLITNVTGLDTASDVLNFTAGAVKNSSIVFYTGTTNTLKKNDAKTAAFGGTTTAKLRGTASTFDYTATATAGSATLAATVNTQPYFVITGTADFAGTVAASAAASNVTASLATASQGTPGDDSITFTASTDHNKLVLKVDTAWHGVLEDGTLAEAKANPALAAADAEELATGAVTITGLINEAGAGFYDLYLLSGVLASAVEIDSTGVAFNTGAKNVILDLTGLVNDEFVKINDGTTAAGSKIVVLTANGLAAVAAATTAPASGGEIDGVSGLDYAFGADGSLSFDADSSTYAAIAAGDTWFIITAGGASFESSIKAQTHS